MAAALAFFVVEREPPLRVVSGSLPWPSGQATSLLVSLQALSSQTLGPTSPTPMASGVITQPSASRGDP